SIIWRRRWELNPTTDAKEALVRYNKDDCAALHRLCDFIRGLETSNPSVAGDLKTARADVLPSETFPVSFGAKEFALPDLEYVTKCAYFDYQREKVLFRTHPHLTPRPKASARIDPNKLRPNTTVLIPERPCPNCGGKRIEKKKLVSYFLVDLR